MQGGFYSSLDADSEGEEGTFYVWKKEELHKILGDKADLIIAYYNVTEQGNWEHGKNILYKSANDKLLAKKYNITDIELAKRVSEAKRILLKERAKRVKPGLDDKILTSWNALMLKAFPDAYRGLGNQNYLDAAQKNAEFLNTEIKSADHRLHHNYKNGKATVNAFLDDYAFPVEAFISLYQATFHEKWLNAAKQLTEYLIAHFYDPKTGMFYYTSDIDPPIITRKMEVADNVSCHPEIPKWPRTCLCSVNIFTTMITSIWLKKCWTM